MKDIEAAIRRTLVERLDLDPAVVEACDTNTPLLGQGVGLDSVEALQLVIGLELEFDIEVPDEDLTADLFRSVATLAAYMRRRLDSEP